MAKLEAKSAQALKAKNDAKRILQQNEAYGMLIGPLLSLSWAESGLGEEAHIEAFQQAMDDNEAKLTKIHTMVEAATSHGRSQ